MVAAMPFIRDDSNDKLYVDHWNNAKPSERAKLLCDAGRDPFHKYKSWSVVPHAVRVDIVTIIKRNKTSADLIAKPLTPINPNHWYNQD